jgi:hypothetical protein
VVLCRSKKEATAALAEIQVWTEQNGLHVSPEKTHIGNSLEDGHGFEFLGYRFEGGRRNVRSKSLKGIKDKIRAKTRRTRGDSIENIIADLNPTIKGWFEYFKHSHYYTFSSLDGFIRRRLRAILRKQRWRVNPDEETTNWRAVCGRTACTVRRAGRMHYPSRPLSSPTNTNNLLPSKTCDIRLRYLYFCDFAYTLNIHATVLNF